MFRNKFFRFLFCIFLSITSPISYSKENCINVEKETCKEPVPVQFIVSEDKPMNEAQRLYSEQIQSAIQEIVFKRSLLQHVYYRPGYGVRCEMIYDAIEIGKINVLIPDVITDDPNHPVFDKYNSCRARHDEFIDIKGKQMIAPEYVFESMQDIGQYGFRLYRLGKPTWEGQREVIYGQYKAGKDRLQSHTSGYHEINMNYCADFNNNSMGINRPYVLNSLDLHDDSLNKNFMFTYLGHYYMAQYFPRIKNKAGKDHHEFSIRQYDSTVNSICSWKDLYISK